MVTFVDGGDITVTGTETMTKPGGYQFAATGGNGPYTWSVEGTGVTIDSSTGYITALNSACGSFTVTCTDCTGRSGSHVGTRITNNGTWSSVAGAPCGYTGSVQEVVSCEHACSIYYALYASSWPGCTYEEDRYSGKYRIHLVWSSMVGYRWAYCPACPECPPTNYAGLLSDHKALVDADCAGVEGAIPAESTASWSGNCNSWYQACETLTIWPVKWTC